MTPTHEKIIARIYLLLMISMITKISAQTPATGNTVNLLNSGFEEATKTRFGSTLESNSVFKI